MKNNHKTIFGIIIGILIGAVISVSAASILKAIDVLYDNSNTGLSANVNDALDETYQKALSLSERVQKIEDSMLTLDKIYPIGSIYISTDLTTENEVASKFGGTWESYGKGKTLVGVNSTDSNFNSPSKTGGSSTATLTTSNLPNHTHVIPSLSGTTSTNGSHTHGFDKGGRAMLIYTTSAGNMDTSGGFLYSETSGWFRGANKDISIINSSGSHTHTISTTESNTTTCTNCSAQSFSVQNPYITVYMYKRIK